jgi:carboxypeptidase C (cathepsin A)
LLTPWRINKRVVGFYKRVGNLWLRTINDAGHLVPMDQGEVALALVNDFIKGTLTPTKEEANINTA